MLRGVFRTKEGKIISAIVGLSIIIIGVVIFANYSQNKKFLEQAVMAENYLKSGSYEQAIEAYKQALTMKNSDQESLTIGLAEAYAGIDDFDKALEVLRTCYMKTSTLQLKEKIEEIISEKTDYEYSQSISRADLYYTNEEYDKAITEYEKAKQIKSKDVTAYKGIADSYIKLKEYDLAREEILEGEEITKDKSLDLTQAVVDSYLRKEKYNTLLEEATEYISQENYADGITKLKEAISLLPKETDAYSQLAQTYIARKEYENTISMLQDAIELTHSKELKNLLSQASELKGQEDAKSKLLNQLYHRLKDRNIAKVVEIMKSTLFTEELMKDAPVSYSVGAGNTSKGQVLVIYDSNNIFLGELNNGKRNGDGIYFILTEGSLEPGYYYYEGEWQNDIPSGTGRTVEVNVFADDDGSQYTDKIITEGSYVNAKEDGRMTKYFYTNDIETGKLLYRAEKGVPKPMATNKDQLTPTPRAASYVIGILTKSGEEAGEYYSVEPQTIWGVKPFISKK
ncbi:MAG TPA: tetratricopeptide repeat protein [Mobilitalea sp.]|nr:tetratricopeptide repeat protein [Mobilitalea sp.]